MLIQMMTGLWDHLHQALTSIDCDDTEPMLEVEISDLLMISDDSDQGSRKFLGNDGMGIVHLVKKDEHLNIASDFADEIIVHKAEQYDEISLAFDPYLGDPLRASTGEHRNKDVIPFPQRELVLRSFLLTTLQNANLAST